MSISAIGICADGCAASDVVLVVGPESACMFMPGKAAQADISVPAAPMAASLSTRLGVLSAELLIDDFILINLVFVDVWLALPFSMEDAST
jgi:hypothetical protein